MEKWEDGEGAEWRRGRMEKGENEKGQNGEGGEWRRGRMEKGERVLVEGGERRRGRGEEKGEIENKEREKK